MGDYVPSMLQLALGKRQAGRAAPHGGPETHRRTGGCTLLFRGVRVVYLKEIRSEMVVFVAALYAFITFFCGPTIGGPVE